MACVSPLFAFCKFISIYASWSLIVRNQCYTIPNIVFHIHVYRCIYKVYTCTCLSLVWVCKILMWFLNAWFHLKETIYIYIHFYCLSLFWYTGNIRTTQTTSWERLQMFLVAWTMMPLVRFPLQKYWYSHELIHIWGVKTWRDRIG